MRGDCKAVWLSGVSVVSSAAVFAAAGVIGQNPAEHEQRPGGHSDK